MKIDIYWQDDEVYTLRIDIAGEWTWEALETHLKDAYTMVDQLTEIKAADEEKIEVNYLFDLRNAGSMPKYSLNRARRLAENQLPNTGIVVIVSQNTHTNVVFNTAQRLSLAAARYFYTVRTIEEAHHLIGQSQTHRSEAV